MRATLLSTLGIRLSEWGEPSAWRFSFEWGGKGMEGMNIAGKGETSV